MRIFKLDSTIHAGHLWPFRLQPPFNFRKYILYVACKRNIPIFGFKIYPSKHTINIYYLLTYFIACPRSLAPIYIVADYIKWVKTNKQCFGSVSFWYGSLFRIQTKIEKITTFFITFFFWLPKTIIVISWT